MTEERDLFAEYMAAWHAWEELVPDEGDEVSDECRAAWARVNEILDEMGECVRES